MSKLWDLLSLRWNQKDRVLILSLVFELIISISFLGFSILTIPPQEGNSSIAVLNEDGRASPLPTNILVNESVTYILEIENYEGRLQYFVILTKIGEFNTTWDQGTPAPFAVIERFDQLISNNEKQFQNVQYIFNETQTNIRLIWELWIINDSTGDLDFTGKWIYLPLNVTIS
jgi:hypothetical protein